MQWQITNRGGAGAVATVAAATGPDTTFQTRLRAIYCTLAGTAAGTGTIVVRDGATGVGTIIFEADLSTPSNNRDFLSFTEVDLRATAGNVMTIEFLSGTASDFQAVNAQGDYVAPGTPYNAAF